MSLKDWIHVRGRKISKIILSEHKRVLKIKNKEITDLKKLHDFEIFRMKKDFFDKEKTIAQEEDNLRKERKELHELRLKMLRVVAECEAAQVKFEQFANYNRQLAGIASATSDQVQSTTKEADKLANNIVLFPRK